ncbi:hypothetical protein AVEN_12444-1, partial [Araneus ventricosus]
MSGVLNLVATLTSKYESSFEPGTFRHRSRDLTTRPPRPDTSLEL